MRRCLIYIMLSLAFSIKGQITWTNSSNGFAAQNIIDIAVAPNGHVFTLGYNYNIALNPYPVIARSTTGGNTWSMLSIANPAFMFPNAIIISGNTLLLCGANQNGTINYLFRSTNLGQSWTQITSGIASNYKLVDFAIAPNGDIYLLGYVPNGGYGTPKLLSSFDGGLNWGEANMTGMPPIQASSIFFNASGKLFCSGTNAFLTNYLYASTNFGSSWSSSNSGISGTSEVVDLTFGNNGEIFAVCTDNFSPKLMKSTNNGASWNIVSGVTGITNLVYSASIANAGGNLIWIGNGTGATSGSYIFKSFMPNKATVSTFSVTDITDVNAVGSLNLSNDGGDAGTSHGLCWDTSPNPSVTSNQTVSTGSGTGIFTVQINNLQPSTTYYVRAFATNSVGLSYGNEVSFITDVFSGIKSQQNSKELVVFPNPSSNFIYLKLPESSKGINYTIYDTNGKLMLREEITVVKNGIDISKLKKGVYFLKSENGERTKIVKE